MMKKKWQLIIPLVLVVITLLGYWFANQNDDSEPESAKVVKGDFEILVSATGELEALEATRIMIPEVLTNRSVRIRGLQITDIVKEGTVVKKGDYVATLDPAEVEEKMRSSMDNLELLKNNLENAQIDSSLVLSDARDNIRVSYDKVQDKEIEVEQSVYESKAVQRQAEINLEAARRQWEQKKRNYVQLERKHRLHIQRARELLEEEQQELETLQQLKRDLYVTAPSDGLVVYAKGNNSQKVRIGSYVSRWEPLIATLPDLSTLQSVVQIQEIEVPKVKPGLPVRITIDAFPEKKFTGVVTRVANVGQEVEGEFFNGFKVEIKVEPDGQQLLPGMTSTNHIVVESIPEALMVPRLAVFSDDEFPFFVYKREGLSVVKQEIKVDGENDTYYRLVGGLDEGDRVMFHIPDNLDAIKSVPL
ncbi:efflux RND transporter periplasmic adaptor subunit [Geofilum sp. OHC36d9]|uniref:efflux RND transporter periplasmic adaptor subunit n=1 Tax=Geofilum sp. OHC36d9 TaxID=3458413 RepID=UPI00403452DE